MVHHFFQLNREEALEALPHKAKQITLEEAYEVVIQLFRIYAKSFPLSFLYLVLLQQKLTTLEIMLIRDVGACTVIEIS